MKHRKQERNIEKKVMRRRREDRGCLETGKVKRKEKVKEEKTRRLKENE